LLVPAGLALLVALLSAPIARFMPVTPPDSGTTPSDRGSTPPEGVPDPVTRSGGWLARVAGVGLLAVLVWVLVRAAAFDLAVRAAPPRWDWVLTLAGAVALLTVTGAAMPRWPRSSRWPPWCRAGR
jgi:hypothetical protein